MRLHFSFVLKNSVLKDSPQQLPDKDEEFGHCQSRKTSVAKICNHHIVGPICC